MDDDIDTGSGEPLAPAPSEGPRVVHVPDEKSREQIVKDMFNDGLQLTARGTEDASDYIRERETQSRFEAGEDLSASQMREWHERTHAALQRAVDQEARARGEVPEPPQAFSEENIPGYVAPDHPQYDEIIEANKARFSEYFDNPENIGSQNSAREHKQSVMSWIETFDPKSVLIGHFMANPLGPQMMEALEGEPEAIKYLANLPPAQRVQQVAKLEGYVAARLMQQQQSAAYQEPQTQVRKFTAAPPPINPPKGAANVPKDLHGLASKDNAEDYIKARRQQEKRAREDEWFNR